MSFGLSNIITGFGIGVNIKDSQISINNIPETSNISGTSNIMSSAGTIVWDISSNNTTTTIPHYLGKTPLNITFKCACRYDVTDIPQLGIGPYVAFSSGYWNSNQQFNIYSSFNENVYSDDFQYNDTYQAEQAQTNNYAIVMPSTYGYKYIGSGNLYDRGGEIRGSVTVDNSNFYIAWTNWTAINNVVYLPNVNGILWNAIA